MKTKLLIVILGLMLFATPAAAYTITNISNSPYKDERPKINDNGYVVWQGYNGNSYEIYLYDGSNKTQITDNSYVDGWADINSNGHVVWLGQVNFEWEIFLCDGSSATRVTNNDYQDGPPKISDNGTVVWSGMDSVTGDWEIFTYHGSGITQLTHNSVKDSSPKINSNGHIIWLHENNSIFYYDGEATTQITNKNYTSLDYRMNDNNHIVWKGRTDDNYYEICLYNGTGITQIATSPNSLSCPKINSNGQIAWAGYDGNDWEIFLYDGSKTTQITNNDYDDDYYFEIADNANIVWRGYDGNDWEIFLYNNANGITQLTDNSYDDLWPQINANGIVTWYGYNGDNWEIFVAKANNSRTIHVPKDYPTIREAVDAAEYGDTIKVAEGRFRGAILKPGIKVIGSGADKTKVWWILNAASGCIIENLAMINGYVQIRKGAKDVVIRRLLLDGHGYGILAFGDNTFIAENNTIVNQGYIDEHGYPQGAGIYYQQNSNVVIRNNIIAYNPGYGIVTWWRNSIDTCEYNDVYNNGKDYVIAKPGEGSISVDPLFRDEENCDYHLTKNSLCIDAGDPREKYNDPDGSRNDMGVFPYEAPDVTVEITKVPDEVLKNHKYTVEWKLEGGFNEIEQTEILWGLASGEYTHSGKSFSGEQSSQKEFKDILRAPKMKKKKKPFYVYLAAHALVEGEDFYSEERKVKVIHDRRKKPPKRHKLSRKALVCYFKSLITPVVKKKKLRRTEEAIASSVSNEISSVNPPSLETTAEKIHKRVLTKKLNYIKTFVTKTFRGNVLKARLKWHLSLDSSLNKMSLVKKLVWEGYSEEEIQDILTDLYCEENDKS